MNKTIIGVNKKGLSPLAATILIIAIAFIAIGLIFVWLNTLKTEKIEKFGIPIEDQCANLDFEISLSGNQIEVVNNGEVTIYGVNLEIDKEEIITRFLRTQDGSIDSGEKDIVTATVTDLSGDVKSITVVPVLLGETSDKEGRLHACLDQAKSIL